MRPPTESYLKVAYDLRPAKQIERRMIIDVLQKMAIEGFPINDYRYTGFGSVYFVDFALFHRLLGLTKLTSVEYSKKVRKRVMFNRPFRLIDVIFSPISDVISTLSSDELHILWLDYDSIIHQGIVSDVASAATQLSPGSLLLVTVDAEPPSNSGGPEQWREYFEDSVGEHLDPEWKLQDFVDSGLTRINAGILRSAIASGLAGRPDVSYCPIFKFVYGDGHRMLTVGGVIGSPVHERRLRACNFDGLPYVKDNWDAKEYNIRVPRLTRKERVHLDAAMPCPEGWRPRAFELDKGSIDAYREIYRFYPNYAELLLG